MEARDLADGRRLWQAAKINVLLCFMPVPYGSHPYLFSLTAVPFEQFVFFFMLVGVHAVSFVPRADA